MGWLPSSWLPPDCSRSDGSLEGSELMKIDEGCTVTLSTGDESREFVVIDVCGECSAIASDNARLVEYQRIDRMVLIPKREAGEWSEI